MRALREAIILVLIAVVVFFGLRLTMQTYVVYGPSMQPNFHENDRLIVSKIVYAIHPPRRGDIIIFKPPFEQSENFIKRVIGLPGEAVEVINGVTYVYTTGGQKLTLEEPYILSPPRLNMPRRTVPEGQYFVMGDNRNDSNDSDWHRVAHSQFEYGSTAWHQDRFAEALGLRA